MTPVRAATFLSGTQWKAWDGRLLVGVMAGERIAVLQLDPAGMTISNATAALPTARSRSLVQGLDGNLYVVTERRRGLAGGAELTMQ